MGNVAPTMIGQSLTLLLALVTVGMGSVAFPMVFARRAIPIRVDVRSGAQRRDDDVR